jgi:hypothetical protein
VAKQRTRRVRLLRWLVVALVACGAVAGIRYSVGGRGSAATAVLGANLAASNGNGNGNSNDPKSFSISGSVSGLYPGATKNLPVLITNQNNQDIKVTSVHISVTGSDMSGCGAGNLSATDYSGPAFIVAKDSSLTINLPVTMIHNAANSCQGATFALNYSGTAVKP